MHHGDQHQGEVRGHVEQLLLSDQGNQDNNQNKFQYSDSAEVFIFLKKNHLHMTLGRGGKIFSNGFLKMLINLNFEYLFSNSNIILYII